MRNLQYANIVLTIVAAALIFPCCDQYQEKMVVRAAANKESQLLERRVRSL